MTELPPEPELALDDDADEDVTDELDDGDELQVGDDYGAPDVMAVTALALALCSLFGFGLLNGSFYLFQNLSVEPGKNRLIVADLLGAAFALVPVSLGWRASARIIDSDPRWIGSLARAAVVLGLVSLVLRLVIGVLIAGSDHPNSYGRI